MSHPSNVLRAEYKREESQGAYKRTIVYPEGSVINGTPILHDSYLEKIAEQKEIEELKTWDETKNNDIY